MVIAASGESGGHAFTGCTAFDHPSPRGSALPFALRQNAWEGRSRKFPSEDAPELVATAPITAHRVLWAKVEAVIGMIALIFAPIVAVLMLDAVSAGIVCGLGILAAAAAATVIQLCFRVQARRSQFRRRQTSSRLATFAEAFSSIAWAATTALAAGGSWVALGPAAVAFAILGGVWLVSPSRA